MMGVKIAVVKRKWIRNDDLTALRELIADGANDGAIALIDTMIAGRVRGRKPGQMGGSLSEREFNEAVRGEGDRYRGKKAFKMDIVHIDDSPRVPKVEWSCPVCGHRNHHVWTGRGTYVCIDCGLGSDVK